MSATRYTHAPAEGAAAQARQDAEDQVHADLKQNLHSAEMAAAHTGRPTVSEQDRTHGAGLPPVNRG